MSDSPLPLIIPEFTILLARKAWLYKKTAIIAGFIREDTDRNF